MSTLAWIIGSSLLMSAIAMVGSITLIFKESILQRIILPLVAFSAGSLIGGAFFHMIPAGLAQYGNSDSFFVWIIAGFSVFFALEQLLHWHHCHRASASCKQPLTYLILIGDGLHNFIGGLAIAGIFVTDIRLGIMAWLAAAAHEVPQELGDFGVLIHGGWGKRKALLFNMLSAYFFGWRFVNLRSLLQHGYFIPYPVRGRQLPVHRGLRSGPGGQEAQRSSGQHYQLRLVSHRCIPDVDHKDHTWILKAGF